MTENPNYPGMHNTSQQETDDLMYKGIRVIEHDDGYTIPDCCWFFATWELLTHYIDVL